MNHIAHLFSFYNILLLLHTCQIKYDYNCSLTCQQTGVDRPSQKVYQQAKVGTRYN